MRRYLRRFALVVLVLALGFGFVRTEQRNDEFDRTISELVAPDELPSPPEVVEMLDLTGPDALAGAQAVLNLCETDIEPQMRDALLGGPEGDRTRDAMERVCPWEVMP